MSKPINDGGPAFPTTERMVDGQGLGRFEYEERHSGMTLRDWFAGKALQGILSSGPEGMNAFDLPLADWACAAFRMADAMIAERERKP
jgi:hypothetical protein